MVLVKGLFFTIIGLLCIYTGTHFFWGKSGTFLGGIFMAFIVFLCAYLVTFWKGVGESNTAVRNTSSIETLLKFAEKIPSLKHNSFCFIFVDNEIVGDEIINEAIGINSQKNIIYLDVVGAEGSLFLQYRDGKDKKIEKKLKNSNSADLWTIVSKKDSVLEKHLYPNAKSFSLFASGEKDSSGRICSNTRKLNKENIASAIKALDLYLLT